MLNQIPHHQHLRICSNSRLVAEGRLLAYNQMIGFARKLIDKLSSDCDVLDLAKNEVKLINQSRWTLVYEEDLGNYYWIAMSDCGILIDGWSKTRVGDYVSRRMVKLEPIDNCECEIARLETCYSDDDRLDFYTLRLLCISLVKLCYKLDLRNFLELIKEEFVGLPINEADLS